MSLLEGYPSSFIDRLCGKPQIVSMEEIREAIRGDLEDLLNTRQGRMNIPPWFPLVKNSLTGYGHGDFENLNLASVEDQQHLLQSIKKMVELYEPRLTQVEVTDSRIVNRFTLSFRIEAVLSIGNIVDRVTFGTSIEKDGVATVKT